MRQMKITLIGPVYPYRGGIAHFTTLLALKLKESGHDVQVISFRRQYPKNLYPGKSEKDESDGRVRVSAEFIFSPLNPLDWKKTARAIKTFQPDKVIFQWWVTFWGPAYRSLMKDFGKAGIETVAVVHNTFPHETRFMDKYLAKSTLKWASRYIVMNDQEASRLEELLGEGGNISLRPHPIYRLFASSGLDKDQVRLELGLPKDSLIVLFFGFVRPYKGLEILLDSLSILQSKGSQVHLLVAGEFWDDRGKYDQRIRELQLEKIVHIYDHYIPDAQAGKFFEASDVFVAPYLQGTQSGVIKLALGYGLPIVVTEVISDTLLRDLPEICTIVPARDASALAEGIINASTKARLSDEETTQLFASSWEFFIQGITG